MHNRFVVEDLRRRGAVFVGELSEVPEGSVVIFSAHGVSLAVREEATRRNLTVIDATCPLVMKVHAEARRGVEAGCEILLIGHTGHDEVIGTMGEVPGAIRLITSIAEARTVEVRDPAKLVVLTQTTISTEDAADIMGELQNRFPAMRTPPAEDICYATRNRQQAVRELAGRADVILVVGSPNSSNSRRLMEVAQGAGARAHLIDHVGEIDWSWLDSAQATGVTAGASAPERLVRELVEAIARRYRAQVEEMSSSREDVHFALPPGLAERGAGTHDPDRRRGRR